MLANGQHLAEQAKRIKQIEHDGDTFTHHIIQKLDQTFITPIDREDIHALAGLLAAIIWDLSSRFRSSLCSTGSFIGRDPRASAVSLKISKFFQRCIWHSATAAMTRRKPWAS